jgi:hypothetical protein
MKIVEAMELLVKTFGGMPDAETKTKLKLEELKKAYDEQGTSN